MSFIFCLNLKLIYLIVSKLSNILCSYPRLNSRPAMHYGRGGRSSRLGLLYVKVKQITCHSIVISVNRENKFVHISVLVIVEVRFNFSI